MSEPEQNTSSNPSSSVTTIQISRQAVTGMASQGVLVGLVQKLCGIALTLILVRIVSKEDFGAFGVASAMILFLMTISVQNTAEHSFHVRDGEDPMFSRHLGFAFILHAIISALALLAAVVTAATEDYAPVAPLLVFGAAAPILNAPRIIYTVSLSRDLNWRRIRLLGLSSFAFAATGTLMLAIAGFGGLGLMCQIVLAPVPFVIDMLIHRRDLFRISFDWRGYREALKFGALRSGGSMIGQARQLVENLVIGGVFGLTMLGVYGRAFGLAQLTTGWLSGQLSSIAYPLLAKFAPGNDPYRRAAGLLLRFCLWTAAPLAIAVALVDTAAITVIFGERWIDAAPFIRPMVGLVMASTLIGAVNIVALASVGARFVFLTQTALLGLGTLGLLLWLPNSLANYAWFLSASFIAVAVVDLLLLVRAGALSASDVVRAVLPSAALILVAVLFSLTRLYEAASALPDYAELFIACSASSVLMMLLIRLIDGGGLKEAIQFLPRRSARTVSRLLFLGRQPAAFGSTGVSV